MTMTYKEAGVNIAAGNALVQTIKPKVTKTFSTHVLSGIGGFGALYDLKTIMTDYEHPVMVQSIDGVGTKTILAKMTNNYRHLGQDLLSATSNDILVCGAKTLTILDYIANDQLLPAIADQIVSSLCDACVEEGVSLVGGETAEMPDTYRPGEHDLVGVVTGIVEKTKIITGQHITPGDTVYGLASSGLHTNGYSLARKSLLAHGKLDLDYYLKDYRLSLGEVLLAPHLNYAKPIHHLLDSGINMKGLSHITGGGLLENIPRILPANTAVTLHEGRWPVPPIFNLIQYMGDIDSHEMYRTFNMGVGMVMISDAAKTDIDAALADAGHPQSLCLGEVVPGQQTVTLT